MTSFARATAASGSRVSPASAASRTSSVGGAEQAPAKPLAPADRLRQLDPGLEAAEPVVILRPNQRAVDAGRADFERVGAGDRVGDIEQGRDGAADQRAIIDGHRHLVAPLGHDLQCRATPAGDDDPHQPIAHRRERRLDHLRDAVGVDQEPDLCPRTRCVYKKKWALGPPAKPSAPRTYAIAIVW